MIKAEKAISLVLKFGVRLLRSGKQWKWEAEMCPLKN